MKYALCFLLALPLAASTIQTEPESGVSITETNCNPVFCNVSGIYSGFGTTTFSASASAYGSNQGGIAEGTAVIDVTGKTLGPIESGWIEFQYPAASNGIIDGGGDALDWFQVGNIEGGISSETGVPHPMAGTIIPFEVGQSFAIQLTTEFYAPPNSFAIEGAGAELSLSFQIFNSQGSPLMIYDPPNGSGSSDTPEPATWLTGAIGLAFGWWIRRRRSR